LELSSFDGQIRAIMDDVLDFVDIVADSELEGAFVWLLRLVGLLAVLAGLGLWLLTDMGLLVVLLRPDDRRRLSLWRSPPTFSSRSRSSSVAGSLPGSRQPLGAAPPDRAGSVNVTIKDERDESAVWS